MKPAVSSDRRESDLVLPEGLEAGVLGGLTVVAVYLIPDLLSGDWLRTPTRLGALLLGMAGKEHSFDATGLAGVYTLVHFTLWAIAGFAGRALMRLAERRPELRHVPPTVFGLWLVASVMADLWLAGHNLPVVHLWAGSVISGCVFAAYLLWRHPRALAER